MSVQNHNGLWGDKADSGKYSNIETVDYRNSHSNKDGTPTDDNTFAHPENNPFRKLKDDGTYLDDSTNVDEMSGDTVVNRIQGNQYPYFEGSVFSFNSTQDYNFGNNYEENHGWCSDHVPESEVFVIPALGADNERGQGIVTKTWANEYNYNYGSSYNWSGGPTDNEINDDGSQGAALPALKKGKLCEYSYGSGYEEVLIDQSGGNADTHYASTKHNDWTASNLPGWPSDPSGILVSKVFGKTFDYRNGDAYEVREGNAEELVYGDSYSTVHGNSDEHVYGNGTSDVHGDSTETVHGNSTATVYGNSTETVHGDSLELFAGGKAEFFTGGINSMSIAAVNEMSLTGKIELTIGGVMSVMMGAVMEITLGLKMEIQAGGKIEVGELVDVKAKASAKIDACLAEIKSTATAIKTAALQLFA
jgi:phage gp45-like